MILRAIFKVGLILAIFTALMATFGLEETLAYYNDSEASPGNLVTAGPLDFSLSSPQDFTPQEICEQSTTKTIELFNHGNPFRYKMQTTDVSGGLCNYITLEGNLDGGIAECVGNPVGFVCEPFVFTGPAESSPHQWHFTAHLIKGAPEGSVCNFKFLYSGWQINLDFGGFHDEEEVGNTITSGICLPKILINKVYYDVDLKQGLKHGIEPNNEWVEIYNPTAEAVDISNWKICDNMSCNTIPTSNSIPAYGFAIITGSITTWQYWENIPAEAIKIVLSEGRIGNGLANTNDRVILEDPEGREIDAMSYGTDNYAFDPPCPDVAEGHILARVPTGTDTDTAADWKDLGLPQVTVTYPTGGGWYCDQSVTLRWTATNPNGPDSALLITLQYIRDTDDNGVISGGDAVITIAQDIANTGSYNWQVSPCYYGYVWIKVIARGPENFMVSGSGLSGRVYEPPAPAGESQIERIDCLYSELGECLVENQTESENQTEAPTQTEVPAGNESNDEPLFSQVGQDGEQVGQGSENEAPETGAVVTEEEGTEESASGSENTPINTTQDNAQELSQELSQDSINNEGGFQEEASQENLELPSLSEENLPIESQTEEAVETPPQISSQENNSQTGESQNEEIGQGMENNNQEQTINTEEQTNAEEQTPSIEGTEVGSLQE